MFPYISELRMGGARYYNDGRLPGGYVTVTSGVLEHKWRASLIVR